VAIHRTVSNVILNSCFHVLKAIFSNVSFNTAKRTAMISKVIIGSVFTLETSAKYSYFLFLLLSIITTLYFIDSTSGYKFQQTLKRKNLLYNSEQEASYINQ